VLEIIKTLHNKTHIYNQQRTHLFLMMSTPVLKLDCQMLDLVTLVFGLTDRELKAWPDTWPETQNGCLKAKSLLLVCALCSMTPIVYVMFSFSFIVIFLEERERRRQICVATHLKSGASHWLFV
jgi:hypothetical protein